MAGPKKGTTTYDRVKATRYRKAIAAGKATEAQKSWLKQYEANKTATRAATPHVEATSYETNPIEAQATAVPQSAPPPMDVPPLGASSSPSSDASTAEGAHAPSSESASAASGSSQKEAAANAMADIVITAWNAGMDKLKEMTGAPERMFPDDFVQKVWKPAAVRLAVKYLPDSVGSDITDALVVTIPPATTFYAVRKVAAKQLEAATATEDKPAQTVSQPGDAPHAQTPPTANGAEYVFDKNAIRKAKLEMKKDAVY